MRRLVLLWGVAACGSSSTAKKPDARPDAEVALAHTVYLNFEGQAVTPGNDDALTNLSSVAMTAGTLTPMYMNDAQRTTKVASIVDEMTTVLAPYSIELVTTRPASGNYDMVIFGGTPQQIGLGAGYFAITTANCNDAAMNLISFVFDSNLTLNATHNYAAAGIGMLAFSHGVDADTTMGDCLCLPTTTTNCGSYASTCTIGTADTAVNAMSDGCAAGKTTFNPSTQMLAAFGAHP